MRWINKLSDTDIEKLVKKLGVEYQILKIEKTKYGFWVHRDNEESYVLFTDDFNLSFKFSHSIDDNYKLIDKIFYLFMENKFGREYLIDLIRNKTGLSGKFLRKKLR